MRANMHVRCVRAHVYAQTVHTLASHEMFISYVDVQTCMARKTPSFHVHRMGVAQWVQGAWALPPSLRDLEQAPPPWPQSLLCTGTGGWALPTLTRLHFLHSAPRKVHGHSAGRGPVCCGLGPADPERRARLLLAQPPGPGPGGPGWSAHHPFSTGIWEGVLTDSGVLRTLEAGGQPSGAHRSRTVHPPPGL